MARVTDPIPPTSTGSPLSGVPVADDRATASLVRDGLAGKQVCPFCGSQNTVAAANATAPCPRCTMEDTAATRQATKARIGPWHVLQTRNPAAPGMRYATLLALVGKGQVTARSVVRGPTTHQLWRYAAHVKGLSREFGVCYSCGDSIDKTAPNCPHCDRAQEPAGNPDALLESKEPTIASVVSVPTYASMNAQDGAQSGDSFPMVTRTAVPILSHADRLRTGNEIRPELRRRPDGRVLSAMELAAALQVSPPPPPPPGRPVRTVAITLVVVAILASLIISYARPDLRRQAQGWMDAKWSLVNQAVGNFHLQKAPPSADGVTPASGADGSADGSPNSQNVPSSPTVSSPVSSANTPSADAPVNAAPTPVPIEVNTPPHDNSVSAPAAPIETVPAVTPSGGGAPAQPDASAGTPASPSPAPVANPALLQDRPALVAGALSNSDIWSLHARGLDAERRQDWAQAVQCYEQIELAPKEQWPGDVKVRLVNAQRQLAK